MGKDSLAMVLRILEENKPLDEVVFFDMGAEFPPIYRNAEKLAQVLQRERELY